MSIRKHSVCCHSPELERFKLHLANLEVTANTIRAYSGDIKAFITWAGNQSLPECHIYATHLTCSNYISHLYKLKLSLRTQQRARGSLRAWFKFLVASEKIHANPMDGIADPKQPLRFPRILKAEVICNLIDEMPRLGDKAIFGLMYDTGLTAEQISRLDHEDIDTATGWVSSGGKYYPIGLRVSVDLEKYLSNSPCLHGPLFCDKSWKKRITANEIRNRLSLEVMESGIEHKVTPRSFRHAMIGNLIQAGACLLTVSHLAGYATCKSVKKYKDAADMESKKTVAEYSKGFQRRT